MKESLISATRNIAIPETVHRKLLEYLAHPITADRIAAIRGVPSS